MKAKDLYKEIESLPDGELKQILKKKAIELALKKAEKEYKMSYLLYNKRNV